METKSPKKTNSHIILLVEDDILTANLESYILRKHGYGVVICHDGNTAIDIIKSEEKIDLILMDIELGGDPDGISSAELILEIADIPIIFLTGHSEKEIVEKTSDIGSYGYILKNTDENVIVATIKMALRLHNANLQIQKQKDELIRQNTMIIDSQKVLNTERQQLLSIFDSIEDAIYVSDMDNYEILFANKAIKNHYDSQLIGNICYKILQNKDKPCSFCTNDIIRKLNGKPYTWNFVNPFLNREFHITDIMIKWPDGRNVRLEIATDITDLRSTEKALKTSEMKYYTFLENFIGIAYQAVSESFVPELFNGRIKEITGYEEEEFCSGKIRWDQIVHKDDIHIIKDANRFLNSNIDTINNIQYRIITKDGQIRWVNDIAKSSMDTENRLIIQGTIYNITDLRLAQEAKDKLQVQLIQSQKLESIGRLAGGLAHDFNNMLSIIRGYSEMVLMRIGKTEPFYNELTEILNTAIKSSELTKQLLVFARKQTNEPRAVIINDLISGMLKMLRRLINEEIELVFKPMENIWKIWIDPSQLDQIIINLIVNASDAIDGIGKIIIETANTIIDEKYSEASISAEAGDYVRLTISDDGKGMSQNVKEKIFEPFYTTKSIDQGTGLGLATVYGIVKQNNGFINVYSEVDKGSVFHIYFPKIDKDIIEPVKKEKELNLQGNETILIVEDKSDILDIIESILNKYGYKVLKTVSPLNAIDIAKEYSSSLDLLVTDVVMPEMNGKDLIENIRKIKPGLKSIFMSGYTANVIENCGLTEEGLHFIQKPFSLNAFVKKIRDVLDS